MAGRNDIIDGSIANTATKGLIYTKKCGWIDLGHAQPSGARRLYDKVCANTQKKSTEERLKHLQNRDTRRNTYVNPITGREPLPTFNKLSITPSLQNIPDNTINQIDEKYYHVQYKQQMVLDLHHQLDWFPHIRLGTYSSYNIFAIKKDLNDMQKKSVALAIFMKGSIDFESMQQNFGLSSGFSNEDLVSNLLGFYRAINPPGIKYIPLCEPVSQEEALYVWDTYGAVGLKKNKNYGFRPYLYPTSKDDKMTQHMGFLPDFLNEIKPAIEGELFFTKATWDSIY